jgi:CheY-like chemotaxis protein
VLARWGARVSEAETAAEARALLALSPPPDLVAIDVRLPDETVFEVLDVAARRSPAPRVIAMSGQASPEEAFRLAQKGVRVYLPKPVSIGQLEEAVRVAMGEAPILEPLLSASVGHVPLREVQSEVRRVMVTEALARTEGSKSGAARLLRVSRQALQQILHRLPGSGPSPGRAPSPGCAQTGSPVPRPLQDSLHGATPAGRSIRALEETSAKERRGAVSEIADLTRLSPGPLSGPMLGVAREIHAASSALGTALIDAEFLVKLSRTASNEVREVAAELLASLGRLRGHVDAVAHLVGSCGASAAGSAPTPDRESSPAPAPEPRAPLRP